MRREEERRPSPRWIKSTAAAAAGVGAVQLVLPLLLFFPTSSALRMPAFSNAFSRMSTAVPAQSVTSGTKGSPQSFWDEQQLGVPESFLQAIKEEAWRGALEPCTEHSLTEIAVDGEVPQGLQGTLFRNGKRAPRVKPWKRHP